jgi:ureidoacrylate peracid hydrolase
MDIEILRDLVEQIKPEHTALIVIDAQSGFCAPSGAMVKKLGVDVSRIDLSLPYLNELIKKARQAKVMVVYIRVVHHSSKMLPNKRLLRAEGEDVWPVKEGAWGAEWYKKLLEPDSGELIITKYNYDAFEDTPLDLMLKRQGIQTVIMTGYVTDVWVEISSRHAFVKGYYMIIPREATDTYSEESYNASLNVLNRFFGKVVSGSEIIKA